MLRFEVFSNDKPASEIDLAGSYAFGQDSIPVRAEINAADGVLTIDKRSPGATGLSLLWQAGKAGRFMLPTTRLPDRPQPYNLNLELTRAQMTHIMRKREDWGLFDFPDAENLNKELTTVRGMFLDAMTQSDQSKSAELADQTLDRGITLGEKFALYHAEIFLERRKTLPSPAGRAGFGCTVDLFSADENYTSRLREISDFIHIPIPWKLTEPKERSYRYSQNDAWINWAGHNKKIVHAGPLVNFEPGDLPEWLFIWEHDFEAMRDLIYERVERVVSRYKDRVHVWNVVSGLHAYNEFNLNFEQLMELTRMSCMLVKKIAPRSQVMLELVMPWGEYYARNQRTIPPMLYADMAVQSGIKFDSFAVQIQMGVPVDGLYVRDLLQISSMLDEFLGLGKPLHISACQVPSANQPNPGDAWSGAKQVADAGQWHAPWSDRLQAEWLQGFYRIAISKPFVESVCWRDLGDYQGHFIPNGGLCQANMQPKLSYKELKNFKGSFFAGQGETETSAQEEPAQ